MELDDLKQRWQQQANPTSTADIRELIQNQQYGPVAALKRAFKKQIRLMIIIPVLMLAVNVQDWKMVLTNVMFWSYVLFCGAVVVYAYLNYRVVRKMEGMDGMVITNLELQIRVLETRLKWNRTGVSAALLFFILLFEVVPYFQHNRMLDKWHALHPLIRFGAYAGLLTMQRLVNRFLSYRKFGGHLAHLKELVRMMQA